MAAKNNYSLKGNEIFQYVSKNEPVYSWKLVDTKTNENKSVIYELKLISQKWRDIIWSHRLKIYIPNNIDKKNELALFMISGSSNGKDQLAFAAAVANGVGAPAALLLDVPNQPLYDGLREDALIAATFMEFITNSQPSDLLLFPMVKSVVKGMDAMSDFCKKDLKLDIDKFVTCGASKRGWTTFLSGVVDKRVKAIVPIVYDNLNLKKQMELQLSDFGEFSEQIADYTKLGIPEMMLSNVPNATVIGKLVDPYAYIKKLKMPGKSQGQPARWGSIVSYVLLTMMTRKSSKGSRVKSSSRAAIFSMNIGAMKKPPKKPCAMAGSIPAISATKTKTAMFGSMTEKRT